ncbi:hypothetical protein TD95_004472 [Thielaviopsis punctulata]|uniref:Major facilitator superfamily (MFS) profile domain-containing protein n=1 Tax=Thielaviopsis punctulata TaxID=72032 RepID=A0A0F4ZLU9_9PEZI|nr:hypothetical protein TD95_004472 [Thielaviopsis punctulata]
MPSVLADDDALKTPTETSPLLATRDLSPPSSSSSSSAASPNAVDQAPDTVEEWEGVPEIAAKMHLILPAMGIGIFLCAIDQLLTVATYPKIGNDLNSLNNTSWIATAYFLSLTSFQPLYGKLSDIFGRKECLLFAYTVFGTGTLLCGISQNMLQLCIARAIAGIGGGGMNAVVSILMTDVLPLRDRGVWQGYMNIIFAMGTSTGAPLGGLLADSVGWRWSFLCQVPLCIAAFVTVSVFLQLPRTDTAHWREKMAKVDFLGALFLVLTVTALLFGLDFGSNRGWTAVVTVASLTAVPVFATLFVLVEKHMATHPFAPGHVIFNKALFGCYMANFFGVAGQLAPLFFTPLFFQAVKGLSATRAGMLLIPSMLSGVTASLLGGMIIKKTGRYYWVTVASYGLLLFSVLPITLGIQARNTVGLTLGLVLNCFGAGSGITTTLVALISNASQEDSAVVIACSYLFRSLGSSIGVSVGSAVMQQVLREQLSLRLTGDDAREIEDRVRQSLDYIKELPPFVAEQVRTSYQYGLLGAMVPTTAFLIFCFAATFLIKEKTIGR